MHHACPHHADALVRNRVEGVDTWRCERSDGLWLPGGVVERVVGAAPHWPARSETTATPLACPDDGRLLRAVDADGIELDLCPHCHGLWLDRGELSDIIARRRGREAAEELAEELIDGVVDTVGDTVDLVARRPRVRASNDDVDADAVPAGGAPVPPARMPTSSFAVERDTRLASHDIAHAAEGGGIDASDLLGSAGDALQAVFEFVGDVFSGF